MSIIVEQIVRDKQENLIQNADELEFYEKVFLVALTGCAGHGGDEAIYVNFARRIAKNAICTRRKLQITFEMVAT